MWSLMCFVKPFKVCMLTLISWVGVNCLIPPCQTTSFIPDNTRNMIRSVKIHTHSPWPQEQGLFSVAPRLRTPFTPCLYLIIHILCIFLSVFPHPPRSAHWLQSSRVCLVLSRKRICFDFFFYTLVSSQSKPLIISPELIVWV